MTFRLSVVALLAVVLATGCVQSPAGAKSRDLESEIQSADLADADAPADSFTRHVAIQGEIAWGETLEGHYAEGAYAAWLFTASAGARVTLDASATDGSDTVLALYGPQTRSGWSGARPIAVNDDYRGSTDSHIDVRVSRAGTYLVLVREYWDEPGNFDLTLACSGSAECRAECGTACPTGSECARVECIRAPCPSYCHPTPVVHAGDACEESLCGVRPRSVTLMCDDGSLGGNTGRCLRNADLTTCSWEIRACPTATACGGRRGSTCSADQFCSFSEAAICGRADATGTCQSRPQLCTALYQPVCGCDGTTYSNACHANVAGVSVLHTGPC